MTARVKAARESLRELGRGLSPRYRPGAEPLVIDELISPLRYDVLVRSRFFEFLAGHRPLLAASPDAFVQAVRDTDYYVWFTHVAVHSIGIAGRDTHDIEADFHRRVLRSVALADSVARRGFVAKPPLTIRVNIGSTTSTGKRLGRRHYPLDGCHRLALLRQLGRRVLRAQEYRVTVGSGVLLDNTARLLPLLDLAEADYAAFIGRGYGAPAASSLDELMATVRAERPANAAEVASLLAADGWSC
jgi:hypothetical protein